MKGLKVRHLILSINEWDLFSQDIPIRWRSWHSSYSFKLRSHYCSTLVIAIFSTILRKGHLHCTVFCMLKVFISTFFITVLHVFTCYSFFYSFSEFSQILVWFSRFSTQGTSKVESVPIPCPPFSKSLFLPFPGAFLSEDLCYYLTPLSQHHWHCTRIAAGPLSGLEGAPERPAANGEDKPKAWKWVAAAGKGVLIP